MMSVLYMLQVNSISPIEHYILILKPILITEITPFGSLYIPSETFIHFVIQMKTIFFERFEEYVIQNNVVNNFVTKLKKS